MTKYKTIIVSDIHLGTKDSQAKEFIEFLDNYSCNTLILNGDIIDAWALERGSKWRKQHTKVIKKLLTISKNTKLIYLRGNHDDFIKDFFKVSIKGNIEILEDYKLKIGSKNYLVFHGDILDVFSSTWKWVAKLGSIGYDLALSINTFYNRYRKLRGKPYLSISRQIKHKVKQAVSFINNFEENACKIAKQRNCEGAICGHIHTADNKVLNGVHYLNSGDWVESKTAILITKDDDIITYNF
jgi:UDP-2,3-diacylglucosamine pyrophosphatase LpxH